MFDKEKPRLTEFFGYIILLILSVLIVIFLFSRPESTKVTKTSEESTASSEMKKIQQFDKPPEMKIDSQKKYSAEVTTDKGSIKIELFVKDTPLTVNNFVFLAREKFYDGTVFHRVIKNFMIQGGDPNGNGTGGPGYKFNDEKIIRDYKRGIVAMANSGPNTNGSQFFIMHKDYNLSKNYVIFGQVTEGMDIVDKIAESEVTDNGMGEKSKPVNPVKIHSVTVKEE